MICLLLLQRIHYSFVWVLLLEPIHRIHKAMIIKALTHHSRLRAKQLRQSPLCHLPFLMKEGIAILAFILAQMAKVQSVDIRILMPHIIPSCICIAPSICIIDLHSYTCIIVIMIAKYQRSVQLSTFRRRRCSGPCKIYSLPSTSTLPPTSNSNLPLLKVAIPYQESPFDSDCGTYTMCFR